MGGIKSFDPTIETITRQQFPYRYLKVAILKFQWGPTLARATCSNFSSHALLVPCHLLRQPRFGTCKQLLFFLTGKPPKDAGKLDYMCMYIYIYIYTLGYIYIYIYIECTCDNVSTYIQLGYNRDSMGIKRRYNIPMGPLRRGYAGDFQKTISMTIASCRGLTRPYH